MFIRTKTVSGKTYALLVENHWENGKTRQKIVRSLGRLDALKESGKLDGILESLGRLSDKLAVIGEREYEVSEREKALRIGPPLIFERLWEELGIPAIIGRVARARRFNFAIERVIFLTVLHRLFLSGSDRAADKWKQKYALAGAEKLSLHHLYRGMAWLGTPLPEKEQVWATPFSPRCIKDKIEEGLFLARRQLFSGMTLVFFDTTSIYFTGRGGETLGQYGHSKDKRPDEKQIVTGMALDEEGRPICSEIWPGNTVDVKTLLPLGRRLRKKFRLSGLSLIADRGMISAATENELRRLNWQYILGVRMRKCDSVRREVLSRAGRYQEVSPFPRYAKDPAPLQVKEVWAGGVRYMVCLNEQQRIKDRADREAILAALARALRQGDKSLVGNKGYRRYLKTIGEGFAIDEEKIREEEQYDGKWVLTTNTDWPAAEVALKYKQLWMVEDIFRTMKSILETRPIFHKRDATIRGHVFCSFLALLLRKELADRLEHRGWKLEWADVVEDLNALDQHTIIASGKEYVLRADLKGVAGKVFQACGVPIPPKVRLNSPAKPMKLLAPGDFLSRNFPSGGHL